MTSSLLDDDNPEHDEAAFADEMASTDPFSKTKFDLKMAQKQRRALRIRQQQKEIEEVAILQSDPMKEAAKHNFTKLEAKMELKRARHDKAYKDYRAKLRAFADDIEVLYVKEADSIKQNLSSTDDGIKELFEELNNDKHLQMQPLSYVEAMWDKINDLLNKRTTEVMEFGDNLESFEVTRSSTLSKYLRLMVDEMVETALKLPQEIERIAEIEAFELNSVIVGNRRAHAELMARMEKEDIIEKVSAREMWEKRQADWRQLRHDRGLREFHRDITADNFTNPPDRVVLLNQFKGDQLVRHKGRCELLEKLGNLRNDTLASELVNDIMQEFNQVNKVEVETIKNLYDKLIALKHAKHDEAESRRENLRHELHSYGALHLEPDLESFAKSIDEVVTQPELEEFMRKSGGLKAELVKITKQLRDPNLIYQKFIDSAITALTVIQCGKDLEAVLEKQGKSSLRKSAQDTLERLRKATKSEILPILPLLKQQCTAIAVVNDIDQLLKKELAMAADGLQDLIQTAEYAQQDGSLATKSKNNATAAEETSNFVNTGASSVSIAPPPSASVAPSEGKSNRSNRSSRRRSFSVPQSKGWEEPEIDMIAVRSIQKQVGMLLAVSDLSDEFKEVLVTLLLALADKRVCNEIVDDVVSKETMEPIKARDYEQESLIDWIEASLSTQSSVLEKGAQRLCSFYHGVAVSLERHRQKEIDIDDDAEENMFNLKEDFRLANDVREGDVTHALDRLRHAADEKELELSFARALELLDLIESEYRVYHTTATFAASKHPVVARDEHCHFTFVLCRKFGLVPPVDMAVPTESLDEPPKGAEKIKTVGVVEPAAVSEPVVDQDPAKPAPEEEKKEKESESDDAPNADSPDEEGEGEPAEQENPGEQKNPGEQQELLAASSEAAQPPQTAAVMWDDSITTTFKTDASGRYEYGIKHSIDYMVEQFLAPPLQEEGEEEVPPEPFPIFEKTVKTAEELEKEEEERLAAEQAALEKAEKAKKAAKRGGKKKEEVVELERDEDEEDDGKEPEFFDPSFTRLSDEVVIAMHEDERSAYIDEHDRSFLPLTEQEEVDKLSDESFAIYSKAVEEINVRRAIKKRIMVEAKEKLNSTPQDKDGNSCIEVTGLPKEVAASNVSGVIESLLSAMEVDGEARDTKIDLLCEERKEDLTEELEERLRLHWPRKGRTEVKYRQPREGELIAHRQKSARFLRQFYKRLSDQQEEFAALCKETRDHADEFVANVESLTKMLSEQGSLAALQGVEMKCKKLLATFKPECEDYLEMLTLFISSEPSKLANTITELLRLTNTFKNGGDYDQKEVDDLKDLLVEPREKLDATVEVRRGEIDQLQDYEEDAKLSTKTFKAEYEKCLQELSLREGLGKKYGAPRRNAQERLRTEVTRDEYSANNLDALLARLEKLCEAVKKGKHVVFENEGQDSNGEGTPLPLAVQLKHVTLSIRASIFKRAKYLEFIRGDVVSKIVGADDEIPLDIEEESCGAVWKEEEAMVVGTFSGAIKNLQEQCKEETYNLYSAEGKTDLLGESGVPESLALWLHSNGIKVLGPETGEILNEATIVCMDGKDTYTVKFVGGLEEKNVPAVLIREYGAEPVKAPEPPVWREGARVQVHFQCHREKARRRLRAQVERLEKALAKTPVPPNPAWLGGPSAAIKDAMMRSARKSDKVRETAEAGFKKLLKAWESVRQKHISSLRPQLGSVDAKDQLDKLLSKEEKRGEEILGAVVKFKKNLLETEAKSVKESVLRLKSVLHGWSMILDKMVLRDDLLALPGDELILPKRKSLKRLRKSSVLSRKEQDAAALDGMNEGGGGDAEADAGSSGKQGRQWPSRAWNIFNLEQLSQEMQKDMPAPPELTEEEVAAKEAEAAKAKKGKGKKGAKAVEEEGEVEGNLNEVEKWVKDTTEAAKFTSFVTTAHRCLVATTKAELEAGCNLFAENAAKIRDKYESIEKKEIIWSEKWNGLVNDLKANSESAVV